MPARWRKARRCSPSPAPARPAAAGLALLLLAAGCAHFDPARARREQTADFTAYLAERAEAELGRPLSLDDCVRIAMRHSYEVRKADLDRELARIGRNVAFTAFLPTVAASAGYKYDEETMGPEFMKMIVCGFGLQKVLPAGLKKVGVHGFEP